MMYRIIKDKKDIIQDTINHVVIDPTLKEKLNGVSTLTYSIPFNDKYYNDYKELETIVEVYGENESYPEFVGRLISKKKTFNGNTQLTFEGELAYLNDIQYPPYIYKGSVEGFFSDILNYYNQHCTTSKIIHKGVVTVEDKNDYITRESQDYNSCWKVIDEKLVKNLGGYLKLRYVNGERYLDYLLESGVVSNQNVEFGKNLLDLEEYIDATQVATVIIPFGKRDEQTKERVTIESVNDGKNYIESALVNQYGRIEKTVIWDDVTIPTNLFAKANKNLGNIILASKQIKVKTVDLHFTDKQIDSLKIGNIINCISVPHNLNIQMILYDRERKLNSPVNDTISLGTEAKTLTNELSDTISNVTETDSKIKGNWLQDVIDEASKMMLGGSGGYVYIHQAEDGHPDAIYIMDSDSTSEAKNIILLNKNGIGFSNNGINGPYTSAWTIDGKFNTNYIHADDLKAFSGKIGGFNITEKSIYSGEKNHVDSQNIGLYQDKEGQFSLGDGNSYIKFYKDKNGQWKLKITSGSIVMSADDKTIEEKIEEIELKPTIKINPNFGTQQVYSPSTDTYIPDWRTQPLTLIPEIYVMDKLQTLDASKIAWTKKNGTLGANKTVSDGILTINQNVLSEAKIATYQVVYNYAEGKSVSTELSFSLVKDGTEPADGKDAATCLIVPSGTSFTSSDGITYTPDKITLTPQFQGCGFDMWQYSSDGITWNNIVSGQYGFTIKADKTLTISNTTPLLTDTNKCLNIKLLSNQLNVVSVVTITKIKDGQKGDKGDTGVSITKVEVEYYLSTSNTTQTGGSWSTSIPAWANGKYIWSRTKTTLSNGTATTTNPACITGGKGATGATGQGIASITTEFYLSTSKTTQTDGSWVTTMPAWENGKYVWTRSKIVYKNPTSTAYTSPICDSSWEAVNEIQVGGRNLMRDSKATSTFTAFTGGKNTTMFYRNVYLTPDFKPGDKLSVSLTYKYKNIVLVSGQESNAQLYVQGSGNVTGWNPGFNPGPNIISQIEKGNANELTFYQTYTFTLSDVKLTNKFFSVGLRTDYIESGSLSIYEMKVEKGNKSTAWTPAPEDVENDYNSKISVTTKSLADLKVETDNIRLGVETIKETLTETNTGLSTLTETYNSYMQQTDQRFSLILQQSKEYTDGITQNANEIAKYFNVTTNGLEISAYDSADAEVGRVKSLMSNDRFAIKFDDTEVMQIYKDEMRIDNINLRKSLTLNPWIVSGYGSGETGGWVFKWGGF